MTHPVDPFEEYLRKKKVEMLEKKMQEKGRIEVDDDEPLVIAEEDPAVEARLQEEMEEFFDAGGSAGADFFSKVDGDINDEKVEEIRDRLEEVFEEGTPRPRKEEEGETFVEFFREVQKSYKEKGSAKGPLSGADQDGVVTPLPPELAPVEVMETDPEVPSEPPRKAKAIDTDALAAEIQDTDDDDDPHDLNLIEVLTNPEEGEDLTKRVEVLSRLLTKLVEKSGMSQSEILEVLIKSGIEF